MIPSEGKDVPGKARLSDLFRTVPIRMDKTERKRVIHEDDLSHRYGRASVPVGCYL